MRVETILDELTWRGVVYDHTESLAEALAGRKLTLYNGFDPSAPSLHAGNLVPMMCMARWQRFGHTPIFVAGGGTGMIGDPGGRSEERNLLDMAEVEQNLIGIKQQLAAVLDFEAKGNPARLVNNADWLMDLNMMEFLRDVGKHFTVNYMISKDSVKSRLDREGSGISYTEFSYMLLQAYDFMELFNRYGCTLQTGGSDQWGNITAGVELIRRVHSVKVHGLVYPLITNADGSKFGKSTGGGNAWLDPKLTSPYRFYQFWLNTDDADVINYLKIFTWLEHRRILELEHALFNRPEQREAQRTLAKEVTGMIHGETALAKAQMASEVLFGGDLEGLDAADIADIFADVPSSEIPRHVIEGEGLMLADLLVNCNLAQSKGDARRSISGGGIYLNNVRMEDTSRMVGTADAIEGQFLILRKGRKKYYLVRVIG